MIKKVHIQNYLSILDAEVELSPFTLLIGANGVGKSNFLRLLQLQNPGHPSTKHINHRDQPQKIEIVDEGGHRTAWKNGGRPANHPSELNDVRIFTLAPNNAGNQENLIANPTVSSVGNGVVQVLDSLKTGDREDLFNKIQATLTRYIPEIEKLSFVPNSNQKRLQIRDRYLKDPLPVSDLSDGTKLLIILLTILYQERKPSLVCIEDIDHGLHPRLLQRVVELCFDLAGRDGNPQIIATTHNPYLVDLFKGHERAVVLVEKKDGNTTFTTLEQRLNERVGSTDGVELPPLGELWFSGVVGGVP